jgi:iron complex transport system ATP-binding protein
VTHNINTAARYADRLLLLDRGRAAAEGTADTVLAPGILEEVYRWPLVVSHHAGPGPDAGAPQVVPLRSARPHQER